MYTETVECSAGSAKDMEDFWMNANGDDGLMSLWNYSRNGTIVDIPSCDVYLQKV